MKRTVLQMLRESAAKYPSTPYTNEKGNGGWVGITYPEMLHESRFLAAGMKQIGIEKGDKVAILAEGRNRWIAGEYGILFAGGTTIPLSIRLLPEEVRFRLDHSESRAIILSRNTFEKVAPVWQKMEHTKKIIYLDDDLGPIEELCSKFEIKYKKDLFLYTDLLRSGKNEFESIEPYLDRIEAEISEDDVVSISYTSGTTGDPKGIMLTQLNYYSNCTDAMNYFNVSEGDRLYIIIPLDHSFAHTVGIYAGLTRGLSLYFVDARGGGVNTLKNIPINLLECNPHFTLTVPALSGNFMSKIKEGVAAKGGLINGIFTAGLKAGARIYRNGYRQAGILTKIVNYIPYKLADVLIFKKVRKSVFGNSIRFCVGGGAILDIKQQEFFYSLGVPIYQGYGLSEATPIISANTPEMHKLGTSGKVIPNVTCRIVLPDGTDAKSGEKGEIVILGNNVMKGYYKNPESTAKTVKEGWLHTGDLGYMDPDGFLMVIGREKALLISSDGEKYSPEEIEAAIQFSSQLIFQVMVYNDMKKYTTAIITLDQGKVSRFVDKHKITDADELLKAIKADVYHFRETHEFRHKFPEKWIPTTFMIAAEPFTDQNLMLNSMMKMVRHKIVEGYRDQIEKMFTAEASNPLNEMNRAAVAKFLNKK